jgi:hypothetical protein
MIAVDMDNETLTSLHRLSDDELVARVKDLAARERVLALKLFRESPSSSSLFAPVVDGLRRWRCARR